MKLSGKFKTSSYLLLRLYSKGTAQVKDDEIVRLLTHFPPDFHAEDTALSPSHSELAHALDADSSVCQRSAETFEVTLSRENKHIKSYTKQNHILCNVTLISG